MATRDFLWKNGKFDTIDSDTLDGVEDSQYQAALNALGKTKADDFIYRNGTFQLYADGVPVGRQAVIDGDSGGLNVFITGYTVGDFTADSVTASFIIPGYESGVAVEITMAEGLNLIAGEHYIITQEGVVTLFFDLEIGQTIFYTILRTSYNYEDLINAPILTNDITTGGTNKVPSAEVVKLLNTKVTDIDSRLKTLTSLVGQDKLFVGEKRVIITNPNGDIVETTTKGEETLKIKTTSVSDVGEKTIVEVFIENNNTITQTTIVSVDGTITQTVV